MPFVKVSCAADRSQNSQIAGYKFAVGGTVEARNIVDGSTRTEKLDVDLAAAVGLGLGILATLLAVGRAHREAAFSGIGAAVALVVFFAMVRRRVLQEGQGAFVVGMDVGLILALGCLAIGSVLNFVLCRKPPGKVIVVSG